MTQDKSREMYEIWMKEQFNAFEIPNGIGWEAWQSAWKACITALLESDRVVEIFREEISHYRYPLSIEEQYRISKAAIAALIKQLKGE